MNEMERVLDKLENLLMDAPRLPLTNKLIIDAERLGYIMDWIRTSVPLEIKQARQILNDRERHKNEAIEEKRRIIARAEFAAAKTISDAEEYAEKLRSEVFELAIKMHDDTAVYASKISEHFKSILDKTAEAKQKSEDYDKKAQKKMRATESWPLPFLRYTVD
jgi:hypothetical protein